MPQITEIPAAEKILRSWLENYSYELLKEHVAKKGIPMYWGKPVFRFADASDPHFAELKKIISPEYHLPSDFLPDAKFVLSYCLPLAPFADEANAEEGSTYASPVWADCYNESVEASSVINDFIIRFAESSGYKAVVPSDFGDFNTKKHVARWSQRHTAYIAGHGTFGLNNLLISDMGASVRYYSVILSESDFTPDSIVSEERCPAKKGDACMACIRKCPVGALTEDGFDRYACHRRCLENEARFPGADVCGKCLCGLPCAHMKSVTRDSEMQYPERLKALISSLKI